MRDLHSCFRRDRQVAMFLGLFAALLVIAPAVLATTYVIRPDGTGDFPTIQAGIDAAMDGDMLELEDGTFTGPGNRDLDYLGKAITIRSQSGNADACVIDAESLGRGVHFQASEGPEARLERITITHGSATDGAGILAEPFTSPTIEGCVLTRNTATGIGGGLYFRLSPAIVHGCFVTFNEAARGAGLACQWGSITVDDCVFEGNYACEEDGGGLFFYDAAGTVTDCRIEGNFSCRAGGGIEVWAASSPEFRHCTVSNNGSHDGGGIVSEGTAHPRFFDCEIADNHAGNLGGGICVWQAALDLQSCTIHDNRAIFRGGGVYAYASTVGVVTSTVHGNRGPVAGGFYCADQTALTLHRTIVGYSPLGMAVYLTASSAELSCCDLIGNEGGDWVFDIASQYGIRGNIAADPRYCDAPTRDFTLAADSPCAPQNSPFGCGLIGAWPVGCEAPATVLGPVAGTAVPPFVVITPNPSAGMMQLAFEIPAEASGNMLRLIICDATGRVVRSLADSRAISGRHTVTWDGLDREGHRVPSGVYGWRLEVGGADRIGRLTVIR